MKEGEKIWYCTRTSDKNAEVDTYAEPIEEILRMPRIFSPISISVQPKDGFTDRLAYGETISKDQRIILTPYQYWKGKFHEGDLFYLCGEMPNVETEEYFGQNANYIIEAVLMRENSIELSAKKIISK